MIFNIDELYKFANSIGSVEWVSGMDDVIVGNIQRLLNHGIPIEDAKEIVKSLVDGSCYETYNQYMPTC